MNRKIYVADFGSLKGIFSDVFRKLGGVKGRLELLENSSAVLVARPVPNDPIESGPSQLKNGGFIGEA